MLKEEFYCAVLQRLRHVNRVLDNSEPSLRETAFYNAERINLRVLITNYERPLTVEEKAQWLLQIGTYLSDG